MSQEKASVNISNDQLQSMLEAVITAARQAPEPTEAEKAQIAQSLIDRKQQAELVHIQAQNKKAEQEACVHMRRDNTCAAVYVANGNFMICQHCQKIIRPETELTLFNRLFQLSQPVTF